MAMCAVLSLSLNRFSVALATSFFPSTDIILETFHDGVDKRQEFIMNSEENYFDSRGQFLFHFVFPIYFIKIHTTI